MKIAVYLWCFVCENHLIFVVFCVVKFTINITTNITTINITTNIATSTSQRNHHKSDKSIIENHHIFTTTPPQFYIRNHHNFTWISPQLDHHNLWCYLWCFHLGEIHHICFSQWLVSGSYKDVCTLIQNVRAKFIHFPNMSDLYIEVIAHTWEMRRGKCAITKKALLRINTSTGNRKKS